MDLVQLVSPSPESSRSSAAIPVTLRPKPPQDLPIMNSGCAGYLKAWQGK